LLRRLVANGLDPVVALRCATYNAAYRLQRADIGLVAAGRRADVAILSDLRAMRVEHVLYDGGLVASGGRLLVDAVEGPSLPPLDTMHLDALTADDMLLRIDAPDGPHRVRVIAEPVMTQWGEADVEVHDGVVGVPDGHIVQVTVHRHGRVPARPQAALLSGWGDWTGAVATTVAHDTHNLVVFGRDPADMALAANTVIASVGGVAVARAGAVLAHIALPIAGILSPEPAAVVADAQRTVQDAAIGIGLSPEYLTQPLFQVMLSSLACLPGPHVTDIGLIDGTTGEVVESALVT